MMSTDPKKWEVWWAYFAYDDDTSITKRRPVLILDDKRGYPLLVAKITSHDPRDCRGECAIREWSTAGLPKPSTIRLDKFALLKKESFDCKIGMLANSDIIRLSIYL